VVVAIVFFTVDLLSTGARIAPVQTAGGTGTVVVPYTSVVAKLLCLHAACTG
jgi:hypothetical protein